MRNLVTAITLVLLAQGALWAQVDAGNQAANGHTSVSDVFVFNSDQVIPTGSSALTRTNHAVVATMDTVGLTPGNVYTVWWVIFNEPQHCASTNCGLGDLPTPLVRASLLWGTGRIITDPYGQGQFSAHLVAGSPEGAVEFGPGLNNPMKAQIHLVLRNHGEASGDLDTLHEQLTTFNGGCPPSVCGNVQAAIHVE